jgi:trigger factor
VKGKEFSFDALVTLSPHYELSSYDPVSIVLPKVKVTEAEIDAQLLVITESLATFEKVENRAIREGDVLLVDLKTINSLGAEVPGLSGDGHLYLLGQGGMPVEFDRQLLSMSVGETKTFDVTGPGLGEDGIEREETLSFTATVQEIRKRIIPALTDAWVKENFPEVSDVPGLRELVRADGLQSRQASSDSQKLYLTAVELAKRFSGKIEDEFYEYTRNELTSNVYQQLQEQGLSLQQYLAQQDITEERFQLNLMAQTRDVLAQGFSLDALARHLDLTIDEDDITEAYRLMAPGQEREARADFEESGRLYLIREAARRNKANKWLVETADITYTD